MKVKNNLNIPMEERYYITPELRQKLFLNILDNYKVYAPNLKRIHGFLNFNSENPVDYLIVFKTTNDAGAPIIAWDMPILYSERTTPSYRFVVRNNLYKEFFEYSLNNMCRAPKSRFDEFLVSICKLSLDKNSDLYWKRPEHSKELIKNLLELSLLYKPQK